MSELIAALYIFVLASFAGYWVIWGITPSLHTPLISLTNAISGIVVVGAILTASAGENYPTTAMLGLFATLLAAVNIFGGFIVTWRMLAMFRKKQRTGS